MVMEEFQWVVDSLVAEGNLGLEYEESAVVSQMLLTQRKVFVTPL